MTGSSGRVEYSCADRQTDRQTRIQSDRRRSGQYQCFVSGVEFLQDLIHYGVGEMGDDRKLNLPEKITEQQRREKRRGKGRVGW